MAEYIERETAKAKIREKFKFVPARIEINEVLNSIPAADVRPVVRCKDCMHWEYDAIFADGWCRGRQQGNPNWFCADGKKREES